MDGRPIGIFDSGLGGLTVVKRLAELLPDEDIVYLGDTGRVPYGSRSRETIVKYAHQDAAFLAGFDIKAMVIACNTVCSVAFDAVRSSYSMPVYEVVNAPAIAAASKSKNLKIGVIGTAATISSGAYETALKKIDRNLTVFSVACPLFVPLVEEGWTDVSDEAAGAVARRYLEKLCIADIDTLILGCTHYPLLRGVISKIMGSDVALIDSGVETARHIAAGLKESGSLAETGNAGSLRYFVTDSIEGFSSLASRIIESDVRGKVKQVTLVE